MSVALPAGAAETFDIGLADHLTRIDALAVPGHSANAPTVLIVGGLDGDDATAAAVRAAVESYEKQRQRNRAFNLLAVPVANPERAPLEFPPTGVAYREHSESHALWRWIGTHGPDLVLISGANLRTESGGGNGTTGAPADVLAAALSGQAVAGIGRIPSRIWTSPGELQTLRAADVPMSDAHRELDRRAARAPRTLAEELAQRYGHDFDPPWYIGAIALIAASSSGRSTTCAASSSRTSTARRTASPAQARSCSAGTSCSPARASHRRPALRRGRAQSRRPRLRDRRPNERVDAVPPGVQRLDIHGHGDRRASRRADRRAQVFRHGRATPRLHAEARPSRRRPLSTSTRDRRCLGPWQRLRGARARAHARRLPQTIPRTRAHSRAIERS